MSLSKMKERNEKFLIKMKERHETFLIKMKERHEKHLESLKKKDLEMLKRKEEIEIEEIEIEIRKRFEKHLDSLKKRWHTKEQKKQYNKMIRKHGKLSLDSDKEYNHFKYYHYCIPPNTPACERNKYRKTMMIMDLGFEDIKIICDLLDRKCPNFPESPYSSTGELVWSRSIVVRNKNRI